ncbi:putative sugar kinase YdjH [Poriferisphaera corsica]|uniref:Putative sugar kinase YdjH n=1 Tax=Poriferisphaera corsica TaxID=2528020 RepID=A0A517YS96_9BACT|nr:PfkB family carbohydrate kinase [Poriferisphaera corsica]QDU33100.1 putative sugar kinase YdjH [Poriferisphaera corsica]
MSLIVTGSIGIDTIETPDGKKADSVLGGSSIYFAAAASYFGDVRLVGAVGEDFPEAFIGDFKHFQVDTTGLEIRKGSKTFRWHGKYMENMNDRETISVDLNVLAEALPPVPEVYQDSAFVFLANTHPAGQMALLENFPKAKLVVADTMDLWINTEKETLLNLMKKIDGLVLNDSEAELLTGESNVIVAAEKILELGPKFVVVKKGAHGAYLKHAGGACALPAYPTKQVIDPTGAGDSFAGGMMGYLTGADDLSFESLRKAIAYGTIVASFNIEDFSLGRLKTLSREELDKRYAAFCEMLTI